MNAGDILLDHETKRTGIIQRIAISPYPSEARRGIKRAYVFGTNEDGSSFADWWLIPCEHRYAVHGVMDRSREGGKHYEVTDLTLRPEYATIPVMFSSDSFLAAEMEMLRLNKDIKQSNVVHSVSAPQEPSNTFTAHIQYHIERRRERYPFSGY